MTTLIKEERYIYYLGMEPQVLRVEELISGSEQWPERFRALLAASHTREAKTIYGSTARETAERAVVYLSVSPSALVGNPT
jgi:phenylacetate-coenzyme A ligase PaaK-like adenylate-forming protein